MEDSIGGVDKKIVHVDDEPSFSDHIVEGVIHEPLKGGGRVGEPEERDHGFK